MQNPAHKPEPACLVWVGLGATAFAGKWIVENENGRCCFNSMRSNLAKHQMETVGEELRRNMIWGGDTDPDAASN